MEKRKGFGGAILSALGLSAMLGKREGAVATGFGSAYDVHDGRRGGHRSAKESRRANRRRRIENETRRNQYRAAKGMK